MFLFNTVILYHYIINDYTMYNICSAWFLDIVISTCYRSPVMFIKEGEFLYDNNFKQTFKHYFMHTVDEVYLVVALIWWFGETHLYRQIKCTPFRQ